MDPAITIRVLLSEVHLKLFLGAAELPFLVARGGWLNHLEAELFSAQQKVACYQTAQVSQHCHAGPPAPYRRHVRLQEDYGPDNHHKILGLHRNQKPESNS